MHKHILIPIDDSEVSGRALEKGIAFAGSIQARITGFTALDEYQAPSESAIAFGALLQGSESQGVLAHSRIPTLVYR